LVADRNTQAIPATAYQVLGYFHSLMKDAHDDDLACIIAFEIQKMRANRDLSVPFPNI
jgi:hypothetical protein